MADSTFVEAEYTSDLVPGPMAYAVLLPDGYKEAEERLPLLYFLHGGGGDSKTFLSGTKPLFERAWDDGRLPRLVVVTPSAGRSFYMDYRDGSQKWESLLVGPFLAHIRENYRVRQDRDGLFVAGISMGGMGALRLGLKYPDIFTGLAALEPGIEPALAFRDIEFEDRFWRSEGIFRAIYGRPVDEEYWAQNNPANIVIKDAERILSLKMGIYLECGDEDVFGLDRGTEFLHRILRDRSIPHEYHLVRGANHVGRSLGPRIQEALEFLGTLINPPPPDPDVENLEKMIVQWKEQAGKTLKAS